MGGRGNISNGLNDLWAKGRGGCQVGVALMVDGVVIEGMVLVVYWLDRVFSGREIDYYRFNKFSVMWDNFWKVAS